MSCINPIEMQVINSLGKKLNIKVDCRHCLLCMIKRQQQIEFLAKKELLYVYRTGRSASFVTLTYDDEHLPRNEKGFITLNRKHLQNWIKNIRRQMEYHNEKIPFKVLYCGEYGDGSHSTTSTGVSTCRPHYHIVFLGLGTQRVRKYTRKLWKFGLCDIGELSAGGIRYLCKYMTKACPDKNVKELREAAGVQNPFFYHSVGLGKKWIIENLDKIVEDEFTFNIAGKKQLYPKHVCQFVAWHTGVNYIPYVKKFLKDTELNRAKGSGISFQQYDYEQSYLRYKMLVQNLRAKGKPINDITLSKHWCKPYHFIDRKPYSKLADKALGAL